MARKRGHGEGSIRKVRRVRKDGTVHEFWLGVIMVGYRDDGKPDRRSVTGATRQEVVAKIAELAAQKARQQVVRRSSATVAEYLQDWLEHHKRYGAGGVGLRPNTYRGYRNDLECHILPFLGTLELQKVTPDDLKRFYRHLEEDKQLSRRMAERCHRLLYRAFKDAVTEGKLPANPAERVANPPRTRYRADERPYLEAGRVPDVLAAARGTRYYLPLFVALATGMRRNEVLGLAWEDVDLEAGVIKVRRQWGPLDVERSEYGRVPLKTRAAERDIPIPAPLADALAAHKAAQEARGLGPLVFDRGDGKPIAPADFDHAWREVCKQLKLPASLRLHDLRGSYVTWLAEQGVGLKAAAALAGHSDIRVTAAIYQRVTKAMADEASRAIGRVLQNVAEDSQDA